MRLRSLGELRKFKESSFYYIYRMICNFDCVANPNPCVVDRTKFVRGNPNSNHKLGYEATRIYTESKESVKNHFNNAYAHIEFPPGVNFDINFINLLLI
jgi:hypothetical protein